MKLASFDESHPQLIIMKLNSVEANEQSLSEMFSQLEKQMEMVKDSKHILIADLNDGKYMTSELRIKSGNWLKKNETIMKEKLEILIIVNNSAMMNMLLKGIFLIKKPPIPHFFVKTMEEAFDLAEQKLTLYSK